MWNGEISEICIQIVIARIRRGDGRQRMMRTGIWKKGGEEMVCRGGSLAEVVIYWRGRLLTWLGRNKSFHRQSSIYWLKKVPCR